MVSREELKKTLSGLLEEEMGESFPPLEDDLDLKEGLGLDSVDVVGLVMRVEREFRVRLAREDLERVERVGDLVALIEEKLEPGAAATD